MTSQVVNPKNQELESESLFITPFSNITLNTLKPPSIHQYHHYATEMQRSPPELLHSLAKSISTPINHFSFSVPTSAILHLILTALLVFVLDVIGVQ